MLAQRSGKTSPGKCLQLFPAYDPEVQAFLGSESYNYGSRLHLGQVVVRGNVVGRGGEGSGIY